MPDKVFDGAALEVALANNTFATSSVDLVGMVKASDKKGCISFSRAECESWIDLPATMVERALYRGNARCREHSHPLFEIALKEPSDPEGKILFALLGQPATNAMMMPGNAMPPGVLPNPSMMMSPRQSIGGGGFGGFGSIGSIGWGPTLPSCHYEVQYLPCGSPLPGYPTPMCPTLVYCCTWPSGATSCI